METRRPGILIVDDEPVLLTVLGLYLRRLGYEVRTERSTESIWNDADQQAAGLAAAVLDASMPGPDSQALAQKLLLANPSLAVIMASGYPVDMAALESANPGRVLFLQKPFTPEMLAAALRRMIGAQAQDV
ncbi:MAG TPA: response regulator [Bryobacteraceae bacterium]|nr:response regulator [Bryobacteraceae bacterium]